MKVLFATSELAPWVKTGGLGDVAGALPAALRALGHDVRVLVPAYPALLQAFPDALKSPARTGWAACCRHPACARPWRPTARRCCCSTTATITTAPAIPTSAPRGATGSTTTCASACSRASPPGSVRKPAPWTGCRTSSIATTGRPGWRRPTSPIAPNAAAKSLVTVHNLAFQGLFDHAALFELGLPDEAWSMHGVEFYGHLSFLKAGLQHATAISTVSPSYAREIQTDAEGMGMAGLLRHRGATCPASSTASTRATGTRPATATCRTLRPAPAGGQGGNKAALQAEMGLAVRADLPLLAVVSRLTEQKGLDLFLEVAARTLDLPAQIVVLGSGAHALEHGWTAFAHRHPEQCAVRIGFDEGLAHRIEAGADIFVMPSRFEPCGLNQMYSLRYGTPPVVRATGGLADTVIDAADEKHGNGFVFGPATARPCSRHCNARPLPFTSRRSGTSCKSTAWRAIQAGREAAGHYVALYESLLLTPR
jgi:starch synthase